MFCWLVVTGRRTFAITAHNNIAAATDKIAIFPPKFLAGESIAMRPENNSGLFMARIELRALQFVSIFGKVVD